MKTWIIAQKFSFQKSIVSLKQLTIYLNKVNNTQRLGALRFYGQTWQSASSHFAEWRLPGSNRTDKLSQKNNIFHVKIYRKYNFMSKLGKIMHYQLMSGHV